jgi:hypothetical protein
MDNDKTHIIDSVLSEIAKVYGLRLCYNTHYEAYNFQFEWWTGQDHHRLDFQPINESLVVSHYTDHYRFLPHVCYWLYKLIPEIFRFPPSVQFLQLGTIDLDLKGTWRSEVENMLKAAYNNGIHRNTSEAGVR